MSRVSGASSLCLRISLQKHEDSLANPIFKDENIQLVNQPPNRLMIVVDGSKTVSNLSQKIADDLLSLGYENIMIKSVLTQDLYRLSPNTVLNQVFKNHDNVVAHYMLSLVSSLVFINFKKHTSLNLRWLI